MQTPCVYIPGPAPAVSVANTYVHSSKPSPKKNLVGKIAIQVRVKSFSVDGKNIQFRCGKQKWLTWLASFCHIDLSTEKKKIEAFLADLIIAWLYFQTKRGENFCMKRQVFLCLKF